MGGQFCPKCNEGLLLRTSRGTKRCKVCGHTKHDSFNKHSRGLPLGKKREKKDTKEIPVIHSKKYEKELSRSIPKGDGFFSEDYQTKKFVRDGQIRKARKLQGIQEMLKKMRANKYNSLESIQIDGELWDIKTGKLVREKGKTVKEPSKKELETDRIIEDMVFKESG